MAALPAMRVVANDGFGASITARLDKARDWFTDTSVLDQDGARHALFTDLIAPRPVLINAAFVGCSSACPLITRHLAEVRRVLSEPLRTRLWFLTVTVDPRNDSVSALKAFAIRQRVDQPHWRFLTGEPDDIERVLRRLGLWPDEPDMHQTTLIAGNARAGRWGKLRADSSPVALARQLDRFATQV